MTTMHKTLQPTYEYFDSNRALRGINKVQLLAGSATCTTGTEDLDFYSWPGSVVGYKDGAVYATGTTDKATANVVPAKVAVKAKLWRTRHFCATRSDKTKFKTRASSTVSCGTNNVGCSECECFQAATGATTAATTSSCPITQLQLSTGTAPATPFAACSSAADNSVTVSTVKYTQYCKRGEVANEKRSYLVGLTVELFDTPCKNKNEHPALAPFQKVINENGLGCDALFGKDNDYSLEADEQTVKAFVGENDVFTTDSMGSVLHGEYMASDLKAKLFGRYQIETLCTQECRDFRMGPSATAMLTQMDSAYDAIKHVVYVASIGGGLALGGLLWLVYKKNAATQKQYLYFYVFVLVVTAVLLVMVAVLYSDQKKVYNVERAKLASGAACVTDASWKKLPAEMFAKSNMDSEYNWVLAFLVLLVVALVLALYALYTITTGLDKLRRGQGWQSNDVHDDRF